MLRILCNSQGYLSGPRLRLGVIWYLTDDKEEKRKRPGDGHLTFLNPKTKPEYLRRFKECDPDVFQALHNILRDDARNVERVRKSGILGRNTSFYEEQLPMLSGKRDVWLNGAIKKTTGCEIVFLDPDNGLTSKSVEDDKTSRKYVFLQELDPFISRNQSLVIYHHLGRNAAGEEQIHHQLKKLRELQKESKPFALWYHAGTARAFFIIPNEQHQETLLERSRQLVEGCKSTRKNVRNLFDLYPAYLLGLNRTR